MFDPSPLFFKMASIFSDRPKDDKVIICNEGGSRSSKTWDTVHLIYAICDHNRNKGLDIYVFRETLVKCKDFTLKDFKNCFKVIGVDIEFIGENQKPYCNLFGNNIYFRGLEDEKDSEGFPSDICFFNESLEMRKTQIDGILMRCRLLAIFDWNPKFTDHWCFDLESRGDTHFTRSNYKNNKHLQKSIVKELEGYTPYIEEELYIESHKLMYKGEEVSDKNTPPPNKINIDNGTADLFRYKVYTLGLRGSMKGVIFNNVKYIDTFPDIAYVYGNDFGFTTDPNTLVKYAQEGNNIYLELLCYTPIETASEIDSFYSQINIEKSIPITADSSDKHVSENKGSVEMVSELSVLGWSIYKVSKTNSIMFWLLEMKKYKIHIVKNHLYHHAKKEQENYMMKEINGIAINQPEDKYNHFWDAARYAHMSYNTNHSIW